MVGSGLAVAGGWAVTRAILGIDPGTACGWAVLTLDGARIASGTWSLAARRHEGGGMRYLRVRRHVEEILGQFAIEQLAYEEVRRHAGTDAAHVYGGIVSQITAVCESRSPPVPYTGAPVATVKRLATGKGNADKDAMIAAATELFGFTPGDDNEADALFIALAASRGLL